MRDDAGLPAAPGPSTQGSPRGSPRSPVLPAAPPGPSRRGGRTRRRRSPDAAAFLARFPAPVPPLPLGEPRGGGTRGFSSRRVVIICFFPVGAPEGEVGRAKGGGTPRQPPLHCSTWEAKVFFLLLLSPLRRLPWSPGPVPQLHDGSAGTSAAAPGPRRRAALLRDGQRGVERCRSLFRFSEGLEKKERRRDLRSHLAEGSADLWRKRGCCGGKIIGWFSSAWEAALHRFASAPSWVPGCVRGGRRGSCRPGFAW